MHQSSHTLTQRVHRHSNGQTQRVQCYQRLVIWHNRSSLWLSVTTGPAFCYQAQQAQRLVIRHNVSSVWLLGTTCPAFDYQAQQEQRLVSRPRVCSVQLSGTTGPVFSYQAQRVQRLVIGHNRSSVWLNLPDAEFYLKRCWCGPKFHGLQEKRNYT